MILLEYGMCKNRKVGKSLSETVSASHPKGEECSDSMGPEICLTEFDLPFRDALLGTYPTKRTPIYNLQFTRTNVLMALGAFNIE